MSTATKKRSKKAEAEEAQAKGLSTMPEANGETAPAGAIEQTASPPPNGEAIARESNPDSAASEPPSADPAFSPSCKTCRVFIAANSKSDLCDDCEREVEEHRLAEAFRKVAQKNREVQAAQAEYDEAAEEAKTRKKRLEALQDELSKLIGNHASPAPMPLFDQSKPAAASPPSQAVPSATDDDAWRSIKLDEALPELSATVLKKLNDAQLFTMGELANWTAEDGGRHRLSDIPGIGSTTAGKIEEATMAFWARRAAPAVTSATPIVDAYRSTPIPWSDLLETVPVDAAKIVTIGELQFYAASAGILVSAALADLGLTDAGVAAVDAWMDQQLDKAEAGIDAKEAAMDAAEPLRDFLATPIPWGEWDEAPADTSRLKTIADVENHAASAGLTLAAALVNLGMSAEGAEVVVNWLESERKAVGP